MQELLVGLVISSIIIGMMYSIYVQINERLIGHNQNQEELMEFNQFRQVLHKDVQLANDIKLNKEKELNVFFRDYMFTYKISEQGIIRDRNNGIKDSFNLKAKRIELMIGKAEIETLGSKSIKLEVMLSGEEISLFESKMLSNAHKINQHYIGEY